MGAQLRVYRRKIKSVQATKKITRAMELISASRIARAQQAVATATPYAVELTRALSAAASNTTVNHFLTTAAEQSTRAAVVIFTSDRGMAGAYSSAAIKEAEQLAELLRSAGQEIVPYLVGRKGIAFYRFRGRQMAGAWSGFTDRPRYSDAKQIADTVIEAFLKPADEGGVDEIHLVYTEFVNMITQRPVARRVLPLEVEETSEPPPGGAFPLYEFEPSAEGVLDALLPRYVESRIFNALLQAAASEHAMRRRAMKAATDNAEELIKLYTRRANQARQAEITQEISEIVGGADALATATAGSE